MSAINAQPFPRWPLIAAFCLIAIAIVGAAIARIGRMAQPSMAAQSVNALPTAEVFRTLTFSARDDGSLAVIDPDTQRLVAMLSPDDAGFVHGAMRGLRRSRMIKNQPLDPTLTIARWSDGRVTATDAATDTHIDLRAFGADNRAAFERFLPVRPKPAVAATDMPGAP